MDQLKSLLERLNPFDRRSEVEPVDEARQAQWITQLKASDAGVRSRAARALADYPTDQAAQALAEAVKDRDVQVREAVAYSIRAIADRARVPVTPVMDALQLEPTDSDAFFPLIGALRALGPGVAAERVAGEKMGWGVSRANEEKIDHLVELRELAIELGPDPVEIVEPFNVLFEHLSDEDPDVRVEAKRTLARSPFVVRRLWDIYNELIETEPRRAVQAGRVIGQRLNPRGLPDVSLRITMSKLGLPIAFTACACAYCGHENANIPTTDAGRTLPHKGQRDRTGSVYTLPVLCDFCGNEFLVAWREDPRL